jgi:hypothetical protein
MRRLGVLLGLMLIVLLLNTGAFSEPTSSVKYLMNQPVSMFDWGIDRMEKHLYAVGTKGMLTFPDTSNLDVRYFFAPSISYDWDSNRIDVLLVCSDFDRKMDIEKAKRLCRTAIANTKTILGSMEGILLYGDSVSGRWFSHKGYTKTSEPKNLYKEIDNIILIRADILLKEITISKDKSATSLKCESPLLSSEVLFSDPK